jgi:hypothetical protein
MILRSRFAKHSPTLLKQKADKIGGQMPIKHEVIEVETHKGITFITSLPR